GPCRHAERVRRGDAGGQGRRDRRRGGPAGPGRRPRRVPLDRRASPGRRRMLSEEALILIAVVGACALLILGILELIWPSRPRHPVRRSPPSKGPAPTLAKPTAAAPVRVTPPVAANFTPPAPAKVTPPVEPLPATRMRRSKVSPHARPHAGQVEPVAAREPLPVRVPPAPLARPAPVTNAPAPMPSAPPPMAQTPPVPPSAPARAWHDAPDRSAAGRAVLLALPGPATRRGGVDRRGGARAARRRAALDAGGARGRGALVRRGPREAGARRRCRRQYGAGVRAPCRARGRGHDVPPTHRRARAERRPDRAGARRQPGHRRPHRGAPRRARVDRARPRRRAL